MHEVRTHIVCTGWPEK